MLDSVQRSALAKNLRVLICKPGEVVIHQSGAERDVYFIIAGRIRACVMSASGKEVQYEDLNAGEMFGEIAALDGGARTSECIAVTETTLAVMRQTDFLAALDTHSGLNRYIIKRLTSMLRNHMGRVFEFSTHGVKDRVRFEVFRIAIKSADNLSGDIVVSDVPTHADIAARISSHREAVTRELKQLEKAGIITWRPGNYIVHDINALSNTESG